MEKKPKNKAAEPVLRCAACGSGSVVIFVVKSLIHSQRVMQNYRQRGSHRPLARC